MKNVVYIPNGPSNLASLFPTVDFAYLQEYYLEVLDTDGTVVATTTLNQVSCCCNDEKIRLHFVNYLGTFDAINFNKPIVTHEPNSSEFQKSLPAVLDKTDTGYERTGIKSNDSKVAKNQCYKEQHMQWIQELMDTPKALEEWKGTQGQADSYLPVRVLDKQFPKLKNDREYNYDFQIEYKLANDYNTIRN